MRDFELYLEELLPSERDNLSKAVRYAVFPGGKRLRSTFLRRAFLCFADDVALERGEEFCYPEAAAVELIHSYSLIHDDLPSMDDDDERRGKPSVHKAFGEGMAVLAGDLLLNLAYETGFSSLCKEKNQELLQRKIKSLDLISRYAGKDGMVGGQGIDITKVIDDYSQDDKEFLKMTKMKTACLIVAALEGGACLGNPSEGEFKAVGEFGYAYGMAFQAADDISDYKKDLADEKPTFATLYGEDEAKRKLELYKERAKSALMSIKRNTEFFKEHLAKL